MELSENLRMAISLILQRWTRKIAGEYVIADSTDLHNSVKIENIFRSVIASDSIQLTTFLF